uniref:FAR1-related sequence 10 n=1 Tax=Tanacetum cinerariifolium TaxID=118510 RepID=A0A699HK21_TANCI|nr:FAR1-related sequence 10 [Tanacetum cinerariifolium]
MCLLGCSKKGFNAGGRELLGLDGAFMRGQYPGQLLTAMGVDANNRIYLVAYGIMESESQHSWTWFLNCLGDDLDLFSNSNFTFITNRQKVNFTNQIILFILDIVSVLDNGMYVGTPKDWVHKSYKLQTWMDVYSCKVNLVNGEMVKGGKLTRKDKIVTCCICKGTGHNKRGCSSKVAGISEAATTGLEPRCSSTAS